MVRKKVVAFVAIIIVIAGMFIKLRNNQQVTEDKVYQYDRENPIAVNVEAISTKLLKNKSSYTGTFEPERETKIGAESPGKINSVLVNVGDYVSKGQILIQLDNSLLHLQLQTVKVQVEGLEDDVRRYTVLAESDAVQGVQLEKAELGLKSAKLQQAVLEEQINKTFIKAPFNGVVTAKFNEEGAFVSPGIPILQITDIGKLRFTINVPEDDLKLFESSQEYKVSASVFPDNLLSGKIVMTGSKANPGNNFPVQFQITNTKSLEIKAGMFGQLNLKENTRERGIVIPSSAIIEDEGRTQVYLAKNGKAVLQAISSEKSSGNTSIVSNGLKEGDVLITRGFINLFNNANIIVK